MLRNLKARASSIKPNTTFTELSHPPDLGKLLSQLGNMANSVKGTAKAREKANMPAMGFSTSPPAELTSILPTIGPVQENETNTSVNAIKNIPIRPPLSDFLSMLLTNELGKVMSKSPKKDKAKTTNTVKKIKLGSHSVDK